MAVGSRSIQIGRYYNSNYQAMAIVAVITEGVDWAAYTSGVDYTLSESDAAKWVANFGSKLVLNDAKHFFPDIKLPYRS